MWLVVAHAAEDGGRVGGGFDVRYIELHQRTGAFDHRFELRLENRDLVVVEFESREVGDVADIDGGLLHGPTLPRSWSFFQVSSSAEMGGPDSARIPKKEPRKARRN